MSGMKGIYECFARYVLAEDAKTSEDIHSRVTLHSYQFQKQTTGGYGSWVGLTHSLNEYVGLISDESLPIEIIPENLKCTGRSNRISPHRKSNVW